MTAPNHTPPALTLTDPKLRDLLGQTVIADPMQPSDKMAATVDETGLTPFLTSDDLARLLVTSAAAIRQMHYQHKLPAPIKIGKRLLWSHAAIRAWIDELQSVTR